MHSQITSVSSHSRRSLVLLVIVLVATLGRLVCIQWGLPHNPGRDEWAIAECSLRLLSERFHPHYFIHPSLTLYVHSLLFGLYYCGGRLFGHFQGPFDAVAEFSVEPTVFILLVRSCALLASIATIVLWYRTARRIMGNHGAVVCAVLVACSPLLIEYSVTGKSYSIALALMSAAVFFSVKYVQDGVKRSLWLGAAFAGLAISSNYATGFVAVCPVVAATVRGMHNRDWRGLFRRVFIIGVICIFTFLLGSPYVALGFPEFWKQFRYTGSFWRIGDFHNSSITSPAYYWRFLVGHELGLVIAIASLVGAFGLALRSRREWILLAIVPAVSIVFYCLGEFRATRAMIFTVPFLLLFSAYSVDLVRRWRPCSWVLLGGLSVLAALNGGSAVAKYCRMDNYTIAERWIQENIPDGARIFRDSSRPTL